PFRGVTRGKPSLLGFAKCQSSPTLIIFLDARKFEHITRLALERLANSFQGVESNSLGFVLLQTPQSRVAHASFFGQPIERSALLSKQFIDLNSDHSTSSA